MVTPAHADCMGDIQGIMQSQLKAGPYHVDMEMSSDMGTHKMSVDVILPTSFHMKNEKMEAIMLKEGMWMNMGGKWMQMPGANTAMMMQNMPTDFSKMMGQLANVQCLGAQPIDGKSLPAYSFDASGEAMGIKASSHVMLYADNGQPAVLVIDGEAMGHKSHTVQHITFDPNIKITAPQ